MNDLQQWVATLPPDAFIMTTQKDWVKLRVSELADRPLWAVRVGLQFQSGQAEFKRVILATVGR